MAGHDNSQETEVYYESLDGQARFNYRFVFTFNFLIQEELCVVSKKDHLFSTRLMKNKLPPILKLEILHRDHISTDKCIGSVEIMLPKIETPEMTFGSIFKNKVIKGWWPCYANKILAGKLKMTLEVVTEMEAKARPAGRGREEPNLNPKLHPPKRSFTYLRCITHPIQSIKYTMFRKYRIKFLFVLLFVPIKIFILLFFKAMPDALANKYLG